MGDTGRGGRWDQTGVPHKGWRWVGLEDLKEPDGGCDMCGNSGVRYLHHMEHDEHPPLDVGCVCAERMTGDYVPRERENLAKRKAAMRSKWLGRKWHTPPYGPGRSRLNLEGHTVEVVRTTKGFQGRIDSEWGTRFYATEDEAKMGLFDGFWDRTRVKPRRR